MLWRILRIEREKCVRKKILLAFIDLLLIYFLSQIVLIAEQTFYR